jgi:hypothetical protein
MQAAHKVVPVLCRQRHERPTHQDELHLRRRAPASVSHALPLVRPPAQAAWPRALSTEWPRRRSWSTRARACTYGLYRARMARMLVGSYPV